MAFNLFRSTALALALVAGSFESAVLAQAPALHAGSLDVPLNKSQVVTADRPIARAMVGNADVADVLPITDRSIYVLGKKMGTTSLTLYDSAGRVMSIMDIAVGPDVIALEDQLRRVVPNELIEARISNKSIVLTGMVNSAGAADRANQLARAFIDEESGGSVINLISMGSSQQVMLEVRFAEVSRDSGKDLGVRLSGRSRNGTFDGITGTGSGFQPTIPGTVETTVDSNGNVSVKESGAVPAFLSTTPIANMFGILRKTFGLGSLDITAQINALESRGLAKTLAQPTLVALSGERASFLAGGEFPVPVNQTSGEGGAITVEFKPFGVSLAFTPTVLGDKTISLIVEPEVSAIDQNASLRIGDLVIPGLRTRRANTTLELRDGESFAIAGLLSKDFETTVEQVPLLGSLPIIGALFRSSSFRKGETELLIVVTPHLVQPLRPEQVRLPTDRVQDPRESDTFLFGQPYRPVPVEPAQPAATSLTPEELMMAEPAATQPTTTSEDGYAY
ncbi:type II and III secretion system protein family protein [Parafrankia sp. BMG5.11]|uniref:type II and III secretion system protein family protein n=1 Tax=Parafrankia sp. BMG5.11 TaxID=222540 RepID=UPI001A9DC309|nr:type II and III secretion system protein family protein [Parafrankia sp. BMG5.11]